MIRKVLPHNLVAQRLLSGEPVSTDALRAFLDRNDRTASLENDRLATYIYDIKKSGGMIVAHREGRRVVAYQLKNVKDFNTDGQVLRARTQTGKMMKTREKGDLVNRVSAAAA